MRDAPSEESRDARNIEIGSAVLLVTAWVIGLVARPPRPVWDPLIGAAPVAAFIVGLVVVVVRLLRAEKRGR